MNKNNFLYFFVVLFLSLAGCNKKDESIPVDNTPPTITGVLLNGLEPGNEIVVVPGNELDFEATFLDNVALGQYRIEIHDDFDNHGHERTKAEIFSFDQTYDLTGKTQDVHEHIDIPVDVVRGKYHFTLHFLDAAGNEGEEVVLDFLISDAESQPAINVTSPDLNAEIEGVASETIILTGTVTDPDGLEEVHIFLGHEEHDHGKSKEEEPLYEKEYPLEGATSFDFDDAEEILIPENTPAGHYELKITAVDALGNIAVKTAEVHID